MAVTVLQPSSSSASLGLDDEIGTRQSAAVTAWAGLALVSRAVREDICPFLLNRPANRTSPAAARPWAGRCDAGPEHGEPLAGRGVRSRVRAVPGRLKLSLKFKLGLQS